MTNDSHLFRTTEQLDAAGFYPVHGNLWKLGEELYLPLYEGKMVQAFDHRAANVIVNPENINRPAQPKDASFSEHANPDWLPDPQFWVSECNINWDSQLDWTLAIKHVSASTNVRTIIVTLAPRSGFGNSLPVFFPLNESKATLEGQESLCLLTANLNAFSLDFVARQKLQGQNLNLFILEQLPVIAARLLRQAFRKDNGP